MKPQLKQRLLIVISCGLLALLLPARAIAATGRPSAPASTAAAPGGSRSKASIRYRAHVQGTGWQRWAKDGAKAGTTGRSRRLEAVRIELRGTSGGVRYRVHVQNSGWQRWRRGGRTAGTTGRSRRLEAIQIKLTGSAARRYDVWYRVHVQDRGWTRWVKNGAVAGTTGKSKRMEAVQVRLKAKKDPHPLPAPSPDEKALNGIDISGETGRVDLAEAGADFVLVKASDGTYGTRLNPSYRAQADKALSAGCLVGFCHAGGGGDPVREADAFYDAVKEYKGRAVVALVWQGAGNSAFDTGMDVSWCKKFLDRIKSKFGGTPLLHLDKDHANAYEWSSVAGRYPLWGVECRSSDQVRGFQREPWQSSSSWGAWGKVPRVHHYTDNGIIGGCASEVGLNLFHGTRADWQKLCQ